MSVSVRLLSVFVLFAFVPAWALEPVTADEAVTLLAFQIGKVTDVRATLGDVNGAPTYDIRCKAGESVVAAYVDARASRVLTVSVDGTPTYTWPGVVVVGHRGTVKFAPENTLAGFNKAIELGADLIEMDVRETKDGHLVIMHDVSVARTTEGRGNVAELTLEQIKSLDAGAEFDIAFKGERVPTLAEALRAIDGRALPDIDLKAGNPRKVVDAVREAGVLGKVTLYCGDWNLLKQVLAIDAGFQIRPTAPQGSPGLEKVLEEFDPPIVNIDWRYFTEGLVRAIHLKGKKAFVNTMGPEDNAASMTRAVEAGADYIQSDRLDLLVPLLRGRGLHK